MIRIKDNKRLSNIELLRVTALLLIMLGHSHLRYLHLPNYTTIIYNPISSYWEVLLSSVTITGVDIFIAISGWFGIRFKKQGLFKYLYLVLFTLWMIYGLAIAFNETGLNTNGIKISFSFYAGYWFVMGYLGLYLISPLLNTFIEHAAKKEFQLVLLSYFLFQSYFSWISGWYNYYNGYSIVMFAGIYLTAAYLRKYPVEWIEKRCFLLWSICILISSSIAYFFLWKYGHAGRQIRDDNPFVIFASVLLVLTFSKLKFYSRIINWLAASCFAIYLIHYSPFVYPYFLKLVRYIFIRYDGFIYGLILIVALLTVYIICTIFDQIRVFSWNLLQKIFMKKC